MVLTIEQAPRTCPRCEGSCMIPEKDRHGEFSTCLICGYVAEAETTPQDELLKAEISPGKRPRGGHPKHRYVDLS